MFRGMVTGGAEAALRGWCLHLHIRNRKQVMDMTSRAWARGACRKAKSDRETMTLKLLQLPLLLKGFRGDKWGGGCGKAALVQEKRCVRMLRRFGERENDRKAGGR